MAKLSTTRLHIDWTACDGRGLCVELLPELLVADPWGYPLARTGQREPAVPTQLIDHARSAVSACPMLALKLRVEAASQPAHSAGTSTA